MEKREAFNGEAVSQMPIFQPLAGLKTGPKNVLIYSKNVLIRQSSGPAGNAFRNCQGTKDR
jgi:hypothetical protein